MKILQAEQRSPEWFENRKGKITGTGLKKLLGTPKARESYFYEILAERLSTSNVIEDDEANMARGVRLEPEAVAEFEKRSKLKVESAGFVLSDFNRNVGYSPDGLLKKGAKYPEDVEVKCLTSANHVRAWLTKKIPDEYVPQAIHAFIVNPDLKKRHFVFYDPRITVKPYFVIEVSREDAEKMSVEYKKDIQSLDYVRDMEIDFLKEIEDTLSKIIKI